MRPLEIQALTKDYGLTRAVEDITFSMEPGEVFGYLGPNGSGKTTTLRCLMGLLRVSAGTIRLFGSAVRPGAAVEHHRIGYLPGEFRLWRAPCARRSLKVLAGLGPADSRTSRRRQELAERLGLDLDRPLRHLSKGNRQKTGVIVAFQHAPELLVLDEPTSGLDPLVRQVVLELVREATDAGAAVLLSSHDLSEVAAVAHRVGILRSGRLVEVGPLAQLIREETRHLKVWFRPGGAPGRPLCDLPSGAQVLQHEGERLHLAYTGPVDGLLKWLAQFSVDRIVTPETSLEDAFLKYYRTGSEPAGTPELGAAP